MTTLLAAVFLLSQLLCQVLATVEGGCEPRSSYVKYPFDNTAYKIHTEKLAWDEARQRCVSEGAHLAVPTSSLKNRSNGWRETTVTFRTDNPVLLPVVDVALRDLGTPEKRAIVEIGEVCFR